MYVKEEFIDNLTTINHTNQRTIPREQEFVIYSGLRLSYLGHPNEES